jgi:hypothetical protein
MGGGVKGYFDSKEKAARSCPPALAEARAGRLIRPATVRQPASQ